MYSYKFNFFTTIKDTMSTLGVIKQITKSNPKISRHIFYFLVYAIERVIVKNYFDLLGLYFSMIRRWLGSTVLASTRDSQVQFQVLYWCFCCEWWKFSLRKQKYTSAYYLKYPNRKIFLTQRISLVIKGESSVYNVLFAFREIARQILFILFYKWQLSWSSSSEGMDGVMQTAFFLCVTNLFFALLFMIIDYKYIPICC